MASLNGYEISWQVENEQLAQIFDALNLTLWQNANQGKKPSQWSKKPSPAPRPIDKNFQAKKESKEKEALIQRLLEQKERLYGSKQSEIQA